MPIEVKIPAVLRPHVDGERTIEAAPGTLRDILGGLAGKYPALASQFFEETGDLHRFVNVYLNDEDVRYIDGLETKVADGDVLSILPAVAGGALGETEPS
ncbi:MAG: ubiquitin-like small modifier protein 1 [Actinomycetota bacterium]|nr:MoaD/ThiS family protein [Actinomycetota bacterium]